MTDSSRYNYRITFRPLDFFFFGGENTFGNGEGQNYYARTRYLPQQTALLGALRHIGLKYASSPLPIGESFHADPPPDQIAYHGYIHALSPLFFRKEQGENRGDYAFTPTFRPVLEKAGLAQSAGATRQHVAGKWQTAYDLPAFDPKEWLDPLLIGANGKKYPLWDIVSTSSRVGITKARDGEARQDGFYKQEVGHLAPGWSFAVLANLDQDFARRLPPVNVLPFGAEKALCAVSVDYLGEGPTANPFGQTTFAFNQPSHLRAAALLCDAFVARSAFEALPFALAHTLSFRNIRTPTGTTNFGRFRRNSRTLASDRMTQSPRYNLLARGSVLFAESDAQLTELLRPPELAHWHAIGYNHYSLLTNTTP